MKKISNLFSKKLLFLSGAFAILFAPVFVLADGYGLDKTAEAAGLKSADLTVLVGNIIGSALSLVGVVFFILMLYGGFVWMIARGKEEKVNKAKDTITAAVIGLIIVFASYALTDFIFKSLDGQTGGGGDENPDDFASFCVEDADCSSGEKCISSECILEPAGTTPNGVCKSPVRGEKPEKAKTLCEDRGQTFIKYRCETTQPCVIDRDSCSTYIDGDEDYECLTK